MRQGEVYWVQPAGSDIPHPHVVIQDDLLNHSRLSTVVVCALTSNPKRAALPGNVLLEAGEANLPRQSVVEVSKVASVEKTRLGEYIGSLDARRMQQIFAGMRLLQRSFFDHQP
ncbi:MAG: type II toxin-antitoxin system PemK/MazF family toxin [bacterium]|nr:type II toxin-antitoxin system PemK/MazF family toxin [bacterium]